MRLLPVLFLPLFLAACIWDEPGRADGFAIAGFDTASAQEVTATGKVHWVDDNGEFMVMVGDQPTPVYTGYYRQPVASGQQVTVEGWQEPDGRHRILAKRITDQNGVQVFP